LGKTEALEGDVGDGGGVLLGGVVGEVVEAAFVAASDHVKDGPGDVVELLRSEFAGGYAFLQDGDEAGVPDAEAVVGLTAMFLLAAYGEEQAVQALVVDPEFEADGDGDSELFADAA